MQVAREVEAEEAGEQMVVVQVAREVEVEEGVMAREVEAQEQVEGGEQIVALQVATEAEKTEVKQPAEKEVETAADGEVGKAKESSTSGSDQEEVEAEESDSEESVTWCPGLCEQNCVGLGNGGLISVLFETPGGFAIFTYDGVNLLLPSAIENIWADFLEDHLAKSVVWLENFETFDDKTSAINVVTGVNDKLAKMICDAVVPGQKLAVGKFEYQQIIEKQLEIPCMYDDLVMELMWGLKNCMEYFVPREKSKMTKEDHLHMSQGMRIVLDRYDLKVEPEM